MRAEIQSLVDEIKQSPFHIVGEKYIAAVLDGVETGDYDNEVIAWLANLDDTTCRVVTSLMWRCRQAPPVVEA